MNATLTCLPEAAPPAPSTAMPAGRPLLSLRLSAGYGSTTTLQDAVLDLPAGERLGVVGSSGAGKSTLAMAAMGLLPWRGGWVAGSAVFEGRDLLALSERQWRSLRGRRMALVPQSPATALNPSLTLLRHFQEAWRAHAKPDAAALQRRMEPLLQRVGLPVGKDFLQRKPGAISIGQGQRILIALALLHRPSLLVADEPTSALDVCNQADTLHLLDQLSREEGMALLYISHDLLSVVQVCDRMVVLSGGTVVETLPCSAEALLAARHPATRRLLDTLPVSPDLLCRR